MLAQRASVDYLGSYLTAACPPLLLRGMSRRQACCIYAYTVHTPFVEKAGVAPGVTMKEASIHVRELP